MKTDQTRALSAIRLSVETDETTSPGRQRAANEGAAASIGASIIGEAVDLGVSASKTTPFERPELGSWLTRPDEFDALMSWRFDRAVRSMADMNALVTWAQEHRKVIVFAEGPGGRLVLDFRNGVDLITQLILQIFAFAAEFEAQSIRERVLGAHPLTRAKLIARGVFRPDSPGHRKSMCLDCYRAWKRR
ncbi:recombinase family protein [Streptomyces sp. NPDC006975]|uniref:recombinase family protein n=1 Tax=Streptomyces sp. NPDC006975 TaxID=3154310 RepID=UPI003451AAB6